MKTELLKNLGSFFANQKEDPKIQLAYLFGSQADATQGALSDYDVAVLFPNNPLPEAKYRLASELTKMLKTKPVDLVVLNLAPIELRYQRIQERKRETDKISFETFKKQDIHEKQGKSYGQNIEKCMELCKKIIINDTSIEKFYQKITEEI